MPPLKINFSSKNTTFTLKINAAEIEGALQTGDVVATSKDRSLSFMSTNRQPTTWITTMRNITNNQPLHLLKTAKTRCFHDHHPFDSYPIGCPISYVPSKARKCYFSEIDKRDIMEIRDISVSEEKLYESLGWNVKHNDYYHVYGFFCRFNCVLSFIQENCTNSLYENSEMLTYAMYDRMCSPLSARNAGENSSIPLAGDPCLLDVYEGHLTIDEYRENFNHVEYRPTGSLYMGYPLQHPVGKLYQQISNF
jgi:hypothetical protein